MNIRSRQPVSEQCFTCAPTQCCSANTNGGATAQQQPLPRLNMSRAHARAHARVRQLWTECVFYSPIDDFSRTSRLSNRCKKNPLLYLLPRCLLH